MTGALVGLGMVLLGLAAAFFYGRKGGKNETVKDTLKAAERVASVQPVVNLHDRLRDPNRKL